MARKKNNRKKLQLARLAKMKNESEIPLCNYKTLSGFAALGLALKNLEKSGLFVKVCENNLDDEIPF